MLSDKEKKEYIEHEILDRLYCLEENDFDKNKVDDGYIKIEELKEKNNKLMEELDLTTVYISGVYDGEKKVEDKIKAKIEEYDDKGMTKYLGTRSYGKTFQQVLREELKKVLQSLLEKE